MDIFCDRKALHGFKIRASRKFPKEYIELMFGEIIAGCFQIQHFESLPQKAGLEWVDYTDEDYQRVIAETEARTGLDYFGSIHSHTNGNSCPSSTDNEGARDWSFVDQCFAIDTITGQKGHRHHSVEFWPQQEPVPVCVV